MIYKLNNGGIIELQSGSTIPEDEQFDSIRPAHKIDLSKARRKEIRNFARNLAGMDNSEYGATAKDYQEGFVNLGLNKRKSKFFDRVFRNQLAKNLEHANKVNIDQQIIQAAKEGNFDPEQFGKWIATKRDESPITRKFAMPLVTGAAFGPAMAVASLAGEATNLGTNAITGWDTWGKALASGRKGWSEAAELTNPGYIITAPLANGGQRLIQGWKTVTNSTKDLQNQTITKIAKEFGKNVNKSKFIPAQVKYYGPTIGKSYAAKTNPNLIDLDTWGRSEYDQLAKKYGYKDWREMILSDKGDYNEEYKQLIKDQIRRIQSNPQYSGKTIVVSNASLLKPNSGITFANTPVIPERSVMATRNNTRHPWESIEHGEKWWDSLQGKGTPLRIDNSFVSDIEGNKIYAFTNQLNEQSPSLQFDIAHYNTFLHSNINDIIPLEKINSKEGQVIRDIWFKRATDGASVSTPQFHSTDYNFWTFDLNKPSRYGLLDAYVHVGTENAAKDIGGKRMVKLYINLKNPLKTYDGIQDSSMNIINEIANTKHLSDMERNSLFEEWRNALKNVHYDDMHIVRNKKARELLSRYGFDGIEYINKNEDVGSISRGLIAPEQLKLTAPFTSDESGLIPISRRDNFANPDIRYKQGGILKAQSGKPSYQDWLKTVNPDFIDKNYDLETAYDNLPFDLLEAWRKDPENNHLPSGVKLPNENWQYLKSPLHKSWFLNNAWEMTKEGKEWKSKYRSDNKFPFTTLIPKGQHGILTPWYNLYNSKVGEFVRNSMFGKDYNLSDEEYVQKHGYAKPITGTGMLPGKTSMNVFKSIEGPLVKGSFGTGAKYNAGQQIMKTNAVSKTVQPKTASNWDKFLKKSLDEQNKIVKYWDERYSTMRQLQANQKQFKRFVNWINKQ